MPAPTLNDLFAQQQALAVQIAELVRPQVAAARDQLITSDVEALVTSLSETRDLLPEGMPREQIGNVITVLSAVPGLLTEEVTRLDALIAPIADPEA